MNSLEKGGRVVKMWPGLGLQVVSILLVPLLVGMLITGCDDPPAPPEPSVNIDEKQEALRQEIEQTQSDTKKRVDQIAGQIPADDTGAPDPDAALPPDSD